jgi:hypothetical protein
MDAGEDVGVPGAHPQQARGATPESRRVVTIRITDVAGDVWEGTGEDLTCAVDDLRVRSMGSGSREEVLGLDGTFVYPHETRARKHGLKRSWRQFIGPPSHDQPEEVNGEQDGAACLCCVRDH